MYCSEVRKKRFNKKLVTTKEYDEDFDNSTKCWICNNTYVDDDIKIRCYFHITGK